MDLSDTKSEQTISILTTRTVVRTRHGRILLCDRRSGKLLASHRAESIRLREPGPYQVTAAANLTKKNNFVFCRHIKILGLICCITVSTEQNEGLLFCLRTMVIRPCEHVINFGDQQVGGYSSERPYDGIQRSAAGPRQIRL